MARPPDPAQHLGGLAEAEAGMTTCALTVTRTRQQIANQIGDLLNDFYPAALAAFAELPSGGPARSDARTFLRPRPHPRSHTASC